MLSGTDWMDDAACAGHAGVMFPHPSDADGIAEAKAICSVCPVARPCLEWALSRREQHGVWGGYSEDERERYRRRLRREALAARSGREQLALFAPEIDPEVTLR